MLRFVNGCTALVMLLLADATALAQPRDIGRSDPLRITLLDALRPVVERDLRQKVIFVVRVLRVEGEWAFTDAVPRTPSGSPVDFSRTRHAERQREGMLDGDTIYALLRRKGARWQPIAYTLGPTDVAWAGWAEEFGAPESLFRLPD